MSRIVMYDQIGARKPVQSFVLDWKDGVPCCWSMTGCTPRATTQR